MYKKFIVTGYGSEASIMAARAACDLARRDDSALTVLYAYEQPALLGMALGGGDICGIGGLDPEVFDSLRDQQIDTVCKSVDRLWSKRDIGTNSLWQSVSRHTRLSVSPRSGAAT